MDGRTRCINLTNMARVRTQMDNTLLEHWQFGRNKNSGDLTEVFRMGYSAMISP